MMKEFFHNTQDDNDKPDQSRCRFIKGSARVLAAAGVAHAIPGCSAQETPSHSSEYSAELEEAHDLLEQFRARGLEETTTYKYLVHRFSPQQFEKDVAQYHLTPENVHRAWQRAITRHQERWLTSAQEEKSYRDLAVQNGIDIEKEFNVRDINGVIIINGKSVSRPVSKEKKDFLEGLKAATPHNNTSSGAPLESSSIDTSAY